MANLFLLQVNLQSQQQSEEKLVFFVQTTRRVPKHFKRQVIDDVLDSFGRNRRLLGTCHWDVKQTQELPERGLVHDVHVWHLDNQEIQDTASCGHWEERERRNLSVIMLQPYSKVKKLVPVLCIEDDSANLVPRAFDLNAQAWCNERLPKVPLQDWFFIGLKKKQKWPEVKHQGVRLSHACAIQVSRFPNGGQGERRLWVWDCAGAKLYTPGWRG